MGLDRRIENSRVVQRLPFRVVPVRGIEGHDFQSVLSLRKRAYEKHDYTLAFKHELATADPQDIEGRTTSLLALAKSDRASLGTVRLASNLDGLVAYPEAAPQGRWFEEPFVYVDRFAVLAGRRSVGVAEALMKALWKWTSARGAFWMVATARESLAPRYERAGLARRGAPFSIPEYHLEPYVLLAATLDEAYANLLAINPEFIRYTTRVIHPDIQIV